MVSLIVYVYLYYDSYCFYVHIFLFLDINECPTGANATYTDNCHPDATCTDNDGSYSCMCNDGFTGDGFNCTGTFLKSTMKFIQHDIYVQWQMIDTLKLSM